MLVLRRNLGEAITLPDLGITIKLVKIKGRGATLGIDAPRSIRIERTTGVSGELGQLAQRAKEHWPSVVPKASRKRRAS